ncbi:hypothetical protein F5144DRAFT_543821 [Chaetomium tenue]|uniref:Uncharacterized protein n=1 Tax=Chaetomium tenue TaxID=1854479 RepID=A0ACB7PSG8_9PEZI|nr:hypothetical protein F5144DRAFT_543821 [Chaetomium globosum]
MLRLLPEEAQPPSAAGFLDNMNTPHTSFPHSRPSTPSEDWVFVDGAHTEARSPQLIHDNMPSGQVANASADGTPSFSLSEAAIADDNNTNNDNPAIAHKPPSNVSTETPGTNDSTRTVTGRRTAPAPVAATRSTPGLAHQELTHHNMAVYQRELEQSRTDNLAAWAANAGMGPRRPVGKASSSHPSSSVGYNSSVLAVGGHSLGSGRSSSIGGGVGDWACVQPPMWGDEDVNAAGAWCYETPIPL